MKDDKVLKLIETLRVLVEIQREGKTHVNKELRTVLDALMSELKLK